MLSVYSDLNMAMVAVSIARAADIAYGLPL